MYGLWSDTLLVADGHASVNRRARATAQRGAREATSAAAGARTTMGRDRKIPDAPRWSRAPAIPAARRAAPGHRAPGAAGFTLGSAELGKRITSRIEGRSVYSITAVDAKAQAARGGMPCSIAVRKLSMGAPVVARLRGALLDDRALVQRVVQLKGAPHSSPDKELEPLDQVRVPCAIRARFHRVIQDKGRLDERRLTHSLNSSSTRLPTGCLATDRLRRRPPEGVQVGATRCRSPSHRGWPGASSPGAR